MDFERDLDDGCLQWSVHSTEIFSLTWETFPYSFVPLS